VIRRFYDALPGPTAVRFGQMVVVAAIVLTLVFFLYEWLGSTFFDSGGAVG